MKLWILFLILTMSGSNAFAQESTKRKEDYVPRVVRITDKLSGIAIASIQREQHLKFKTNGEYDAYIAREIAPKVERELNVVKRPNELLMIGRICRAILANQDADDMVYDRVFDIAYWHCVSLLAVSKHSEAEKNLGFLKEASYLNGGEPGLFDEVVSNSRRAAKKLRKN